MSEIANDARESRQSRMAAGLLFALASAASFGLSGSLARGLLEQGWSAGAAVTARVLLAALVLVVPALVALRGRWMLLRESAGLVLAYGLVAVAGCQLSYFFAVSYMQVGVALLIEYTAPVAVLAWMWLRHGQQPTRRTIVGAGIAAVGLVLVLDLLSGASLSLPGVLWALGAMVGAATYFILSADEDNGLPPIVLAAGGLTAGGVGLLLAGLIGILPMRASTADVAFRGVTVPWWLPVAALGVVTAAIAYVTGIAASRRLGSRLASFVALTEVVAALVFAWLLLGELPGWVQGIGGLLIVGGVVLVKLGEPRLAVGEAEAATPAQVAAPEAPSDGSFPHRRAAAGR